MFRVVGTRWLLAVPLAAVVGAHGGRAQTAATRSATDTLELADTALFGVDTVLTLEAHASAGRVSPDVARQTGAVESARSGERVSVGSYLPTLQRAVRSGTRARPSALV